jgi:hypothetical protein
VQRPTSTNEDVNSRVPNVELKQRTAAAPQFSTILVEGDEMARVVGGVGELGSLKVEEKRKTLRGSLLHEGAQKGNHALED